MSDERAEIQGPDANAVTRASNAGIEAVRDVLLDEDAASDKTRIIVIVSQAKVPEGETDSTTGAAPAFDGQDYEPTDVLVDLFYHLQMIFEANGKTLMMAPLHGRAEDN